MFYCHYQKPKLLLFYFFISLVFIHLCNDNNMFLFSTKFFIVQFITELNNKLNSIDGIIKIMSEK